MADPKPRKKVTYKTLLKKMEAGEPITQLAAYDYRTAVVADRLGMDILCVSDTGGMILFGHQSTTSVSFDEVMMMSKAIDRGSQYGTRFDHDARAARQRFALGGTAACYTPRVEGATHSRRGHSTAQRHALCSARAEPVPARCRQPPSVCAHSGTAKHGEL